MNAITTTEINLNMPGVRAELVVPESGHHYYRLHLTGWAATVFGCSTRDYTHEEYCMRGWAGAPFAEKMRERGYQANIHGYYTHDLIEIHRALIDFMESPTGMERTHDVVRSEPERVCNRIVQWVAPHMLWLRQFSSPAGQEAASRIARGDI